MIGLLHEIAKRAEEASGDGVTIMIVATTAGISILGTRFNVGWREEVVSWPTLDAADTAEGESRVLFNALELVIASMKSLPA